MWSASQIHLLVVHLPVVGCPFVLALLLLGHRLKSDLLMRVGYGFLTAVAAFGVVAYYSGPPAFEGLESELAAERPWVEQHALVARAAFVVLVVAGVLAVQAWLQFLQEEPPGRWLRRSILILVLVVTYLLAWSAHLGGQIRHPEIRHPGLPLFPHLQESSSP